MGFDQPEVCIASLLSKIITSESGSDLEEGIWRYPRDMYASLTRERSIPDICAVVRAVRRESSGVDGSEIELYGANKLVSEVEVDLKEAMEGPTSPDQPESLVIM